MYRNGINFIIWKQNIDSCSNRVKTHSSGYSNLLLQNTHHVLDHFGFDFPGTKFDTSNEFFPGTGFKIILIHLLLQYAPKNFNGSNFGAARGVFVLLHALFLVAEATTGHSSRTDLRLNQARTRHFWVNHTCWRWKEADAIVKCPGILTALSSRLYFRWKYHSLQTS